MTLRPEDVTAENAGQALDEMAASMRPLVTQARRVYEVSSALAAQTGRPEDRAAAASAERAVLELDGALAELLAVKP